MGVSRPTKSDPCPKQRCPFNRGNKYKDFVNIFPEQMLCPLNGGVSKERLQCKNQGSNHFFFVFSFLPCFLSSLLGTKNLPFDPFSLKCLQLSLGSFQPRGQRPLETRLGSSSKKSTRINQAASPHSFKINTLYLFMVFGVNLSLSRC